MSFSTGNSCEESKCPLSRWNFNNTIYSYSCPQHGQQFSTSFKFTSSGYILDFYELNSEKILSIPLRYNQNVNQNGLQFIGQMQNNMQIAIFNCTYDISKQYTHLCLDNELVVGKLINNTFHQNCGYGLNKFFKTLENS
ncbi:hypothetical protein TTHERM_00630180 (macronuclear) [Tetrahymena thermophila SB210]|uniref:Uncharacterized protein n=1 Tax=Tetrahymena thermophila (strain SB210) TaxID=312017 RepID=Q241R7_TETTS|nr:hypothetical protein TTHERM_00630180 [Tetrahymena thermophila SB210]EAS02503.1 hypothetical protein TTHERM_00630180 [Tetrahymena thermophila SB210]|eukprot:XP_001022748.1 hypothetical protein TTHERM_00630180 [Tetrahymena thermophila SB210]